jgi:hypothetical protein
VEEDRPEPQAGQVRVKVLAAGVSAYDLMFRSSGLLLDLDRPIGGKFLKVLNQHLPVFIEIAYVNIGNPRLRLARISKRSP